MRGVLGGEDGCLLGGKGGCLLGGEGGAMRGGGNVSDLLFTSIR